MIKLTLDSSAILDYSIEDFLKHFVYNKRRKMIYENFEKYLSDLKKLMNGEGFEQWVDGSFTTIEETPNDIDVVSIIPHHCRDGKTHLFYKFTPEDGVKEKYGNVVDAYMVIKYPENDARYALTKEGLEHFYRVWGSDREHNPKNIICLKQ